MWSVQTDMWGVCESRREGERKRGGIERGRKGGRERERERERGME